MPWTETRPQDEVPLEITSSKPTTGTTQMTNGIRNRAPVAQGVEGTRRIRECGHIKQSLWTGTMDPTMTAGHLHQTPQAIMRAENGAVIMTGALVVIASGL